MGANTKVYIEQGGNRLVVASGGEIAVESGATLTINGVEMSETNLSGVTASSAELNVLDGNTSTTAELSELHGAAFQITQVSTPASGSNGTQFTFKDAAGVAVAVPVSGLGYLASDAAGLTPVAADTSIATLTNGHVTELVTKGPPFHFVTTAAGLLGITVTAAAGTYYLAFVLPNGKIAVSSAIVVNA